MSGKVLVERATKGHVEELVPATDAEDGEAALASQADELQFVGITDGVDVLERRHGLFAKQVGADVASSGQEQAVETLDDCSKDAEIGRGRHKHGGAACQDDRLEIGVSEHLFAVSSVDGNADAWARSGAGISSRGAVDLCEQFF